MTDFNSSIKTIPFNAERIFAKLSDLNNLKDIKDKLPEDKVKDLSFDTDTFSFHAEGVGKIIVRIVEREPGKTIKLESEKSPVPFTCWIQLKEISPDDTKLKLTLRADIPFLFKSMITKPIETGIEKAAEALASLNY